MYVVRSSLRRKDGMGRSLFSIYVCMIYSMDNPWIISRLAAELVIFRAGLAFSILIISYYYAMMVNLIMYDDMI
jgi:hypothetical protein